VRILILVALLLAFPATAAASQVSGPPGGDVEFQAYPGETNRVTVIPSASGPYQVEVRDDGANLLAGPGCTSIGLHTARCGLPPGPPPSRCGSMDILCFFRATFGDGDDTLALNLPGYFNELEFEAGADAMSVEGVTFVRASGGEGDDRLLGGESGDSINGGPGADFVQGRGSAHDIVSYDEPWRTAGVHVRLDDAPGDGGPGEGDDVRAESITGSRFDDVIVGNDLDNRIKGGGGDDRIACRGGRDTVYTSFLQGAGRGCEFVALSEEERWITRVSEAPLQVQDGAVSFGVSGSPEGRVRLATGGGIRLGAAPVPASSDHQPIPIELSRRIMRWLGRRPAWTVRLTCTVPGKSISRALTRLTL